MACLKPLLAASILTLLPALSSAEIITKPEVEALIRAGDHATLDVGLAAAQAAYRKGDLSPDEVRRLYEPFGTLNRETLAFARDWLGEHPDSTQAQMAVGWLSYTLAWNMRGIEPWAYTHPQARRAFEDLMTTSGDLARKAFDADPAFLPATDLLLYNLTYGDMAPHRDAHAQFVARVMDSTPSMGTLTRAFRYTDRGWGGNFDYGLQLCRDHAHKVPDAWHGAPEKYCELTLIAYHHRDALDDTHIGWLEDLDGPDADTLRRHLTLWTPLYHQPWIDDLGDWMRNSDYSDTSGAWQFDVSFAQHGLARGVSDAVKARARAASVARLETNPDDVDALTGDSHVSFHRLGLPGRGADTITAERRDALRRAYRLVTINPYSVAYWRNYRNVLNTTVGSDHPAFRAADDNVLAYSNHRPSNIMARVDAVSGELMTMGMMRNQARMLNDPDYGPTQEAYAKLLCPAIEDLRLVAHFCEFDPTYECRDHQVDASTRLSALIDQAEADTICRMARIKAARTLVKKPVPLTDPGIDWPTGENGS